LFLLMVDCGGDWWKAHWIGKQWIWWGRVGSSCICILNGGLLWSKQWGSWFLILFWEHTWQVAMKRTIKKKKDVVSTVLLLRGICQETEWEQIELKKDWPKRPPSAHPANPLFWFIQSCNFHQHFFIYLVIRWCSWYSDFSDPNGFSEVESRFEFAT
jgi:hypothetical protein